MPSTVGMTAMTMPVILLTARSEVSDIITGLDAGSDDYLAKPFSTGKLLARIRALSRRGGSYTGEVLSYEDLTFDKDSLELSGKTGSIRLSRKSSFMQKKAADLKCTSKPPPFYRHTKSPALQRFFLFPLNGQENRAIKFISVPVLQPLSASQNLFR